MRRRIYLMRHADVAYYDTARVAARTAVLTERGRAQAAASGKALAAARFDRVITSGLPRTIQTAQIILDQTEHPDPPEIEECPAFEEFRNHQLDRVEDEEIDAAFLGVFHGLPDREARFLQGESVGSMIDRVNAAIDRFVAEDDWQTALLVLHGGPNRVILSRALTDERRFIGRIEQSPACINIIDFVPEWFVRSMNTTVYEPVPVASRRTSIEGHMEGYRKHRRQYGRTQ